MCPEGNWKTILKSKKSGNEKWKENALRGNWVKKNSGKKLQVIERETQGKIDKAKTQVGCV
jgi:hypothetical protein